MFKVEFSKKKKVNLHINDDMKLKLSETIGTATIKRPRKNREHYSKFWTSTQVKS